MTLGDTFIWDPDGGTNPHLYIIVTDPTVDEEFVVVNLTKSLNGPKAVTFQIGDHPFIKKYPSDANFGDSMIVSLSNIQEELASGSATMHSPFAHYHLRRIGIAAKDHPACSYEVQDRCKRQWP